MFRTTKKFADNWELYQLTPEETKELVASGDDQKAMDAFYRNSARVIIRIISRYRNIDKDLLAEAGYIGLQRCYEHLKRNQHKLIKYPHFHKNAYLWCSASVSQMVTKEQKKTNEIRDSIFFSYAQVDGYTKYDELLETFKHHLSEDDFKLLKLHLDGTKKRKGSSIMGCSMQEFSQRLSDIQDRVAQLVKDTV